MVQMVLLVVLLFTLISGISGKNGPGKVAFVNPKGIQTHQPKIAELARLPWVGIDFFLNPNGVASAVSPQFASTPSELV